MFIKLNNVSYSVNCDLKYLLKIEAASGETTIIFAKADIVVDTFYTLGNDIFDRYRKGIRIPSDGSQE